jgi:AraC-like DNA-binding protein
MFIDFHSIPKSYFHFVDGLPVDYRGPVLPGSRIISGTGEPGTLILQEVRDESFNVQLSIFYFFRKFSLTFGSSNAMLQILFALKNKFMFKARPIRNIQLKQDQHTTLHIPVLQVEALFEKEKEYHLLDIQYTAEPVQELAKFYPKLQSFFSKIAKGKPFIFSKPSRTTDKAKDIVQEILHSPYDQDLQKYFFDKVIKQFLIENLFQDLSIQPVTIVLTEDEKKKIADLENLLTSNLDVYYPIPDLARTTQMNKTKLQAGFKQIFGRTVFDYQLNARLVEGRRLIIEEKMRIKEVCALVGYKRISSFIAEFKDKFGYSPGSLIKKP